MSTVIRRPLITLRRRVVVTVTRFCRPAETFYEIREKFSRRCSPLRVTRFGEYGGMRRGKHVRRVVFISRHRSKYVYTYVFRSIDLEIVSTVCCWFFAPFPLVIVQFPVIHVQLRILIGGYYKRRNKYASCITRSWRRINIINRSAV